MIELELRCSCGNVVSLGIKPGGYKDFESHTHTSSTIHGGYYAVSPNTQYICCNCGKDMTRHVVKVTEETKRVDIIN